MTKRTKIIIVVIAILVLLLAAYFLFRKKKAAEPLLPQTQGTSPTVSTGTNSPKFTPNKFPLDLGMQGEYVFALQRALNRISPGSKIPEDSIFGQATKNKLLLTVSTAQSVLPMSGATWQQIIIDSNK